MTGIQKTDNITSRQQYFLTPKNTGYAAAGAMLLTSIRAFSKDKKIIKSHKLLGYITAVLTTLHIGLTEYYHHKYKKM